MASQKNGARALYALCLAAVLLSGFWFTEADALCTPLGSVTAQLGLCKPLAGETGWTNAINNNWDTIDANVGTIPTGAIMFYGGNSPPTGWYVCDGSAKSRTSDANLYAIFGTTYGAGDGSTTFNLPNAASRTPMFSGTGSFASSTDFSNINTGTDTITVPSNNSYYTGTLVTYSTSGTQIGGLTNGNPYYIINTSPTTIKLATSQANAVAGAAIDLTTQGTNSHTFTVAYSTRNLADLGGEETHTLTPPEVIVRLTDNNGTALFLKGGAGSGSSQREADSVNQTTNNPTPHNTSSNVSHNVLSPFITFTCMVKR